MIVINQQVLNQVINQVFIKLWNYQDKATVTNLIKHWPSWGTLRTVINNFKNLLKTDFELAVNDDLVLKLNFKIMLIYKPTKDIWQSIFS